MNQAVLDRLGLSLQIISADEADYEIFQEASDADCCIQFGISDFENGWFPLGDVLDTYDRQNPGLAKYILRMLSGCPLQVGTPETIYEFASEFCWFGNENEQEIFDECYGEYLESGESEEDSREAALEITMVEYAEFEEYLPEWTFNRSATAHRIQIEPCAAVLRRTWRNDGDTAQSPKSPTAVRKKHLNSGCRRTVRFGKPVPKDVVSSAGVDRMVAQ